MIPIPITHLIYALSRKVGDLEGLICNSKSLAGEDFMSGARFDYLLNLPLS
jgi:hypothetical protein